ATAEPNPAPLANDDSKSVQVIAEADLEAISQTALVQPPAPPLYANSSSRSNVDFTFVFRNNGPSDARNVEVLDLEDLSAAIPNGYIVSSFGFCSTPDPGSCTPSTTSTAPTTAGHLAIGTVTAGDRYTVVIHASADPALR